MSENNFEQEIKQSILNRKFLIIKDTPFCLCPIEHCEYLYFGTGKNAKPNQCNECKLKQFCDYNKKSNLKIKPIKICDADLLKFLEERDENINDWF